MKSATALEAQLLSILVSPRTGIETNREYQFRFGKKIGPGTFYTTLRRMRELKWLNAWKDKTGDIRLLWMQASPAGNRALKSWIDQAKAVADWME